MSLMVVLLTVPHMKSHLIDAVPRNFGFVIRVFPAADSEYGYSTPLALPGESASGPARATRRRCCRDSGRRS